MEHSANRPGPNLSLLALAFAAGVWLAQQQAQLAAVWPALVAAALLGGLALVGRGRAIAFWLLAGALLAAGFGYADWRAERRLAEVLDPALAGRDVVLTGTLVSLPQRSAYGLRFEFRPQAPPPGVPSRLLLGWWLAPGSDAAQPAGLPAAGERWRLTLRLKPPHGLANPGGFDYEAWLFEHGLRATGYVRADPPPQRLGADPGIEAALARLRAGLRARFAAILPDDAARAVLVALALGDQGGISPAWWEVFRATGVTHLISISGLHVTLIAALVGALVSAGWRRVPAWCLRLPAQRAAVLAGAVAAGGYTLLAGFGVPAQRTLYMLVVAALALWTGRAGRPTAVLAVALVLVLGIDPWAVLAPGFWLSFLAVAALLLADAGRLGRTGRLATWMRAQWAATLVSLPLLLALFQQCSLISPLANAIAIPVVSLVITPLALLFAVLPLPSVAALAHGLTAVLLAALEWAGQSPAALWSQAQPPAWLTVLGVLAALAALLPRGTPGRWPALLVLPALLAWNPPRPAPASLRVTVLDVGQGLAVHLQTAGHDLLFDTGPAWSEDADAGGRVVLPYLRAVGVTRLDELLVSHADIDHAGGAQSLLHGLPVTRLRASLPPAHPLRRAGPPYLDCRAGQRWVWDGVLFEVLNPGTATPAGDNARACVLRVTAPGGRLLLPADIEAATELELLARTPAALAAELLVVPHHGSRTSSLPAFVAAVGAHTVFYPVGYRNRHGHPHPQIAARYAATGAQAWASDRDGALQIEVGADGPRVTSWRARRRRYWHDGTAP